MRRDTPIDENGVLDTGRSPISTKARRLAATIQSIAPANSSSGPDPLLGTSSPSYSCCGGHAAWNSRDVSEKLNAPPTAPGAAKTGNALAGVAGQIGLRLDHRQHPRGRRGGIVDETRERIGHR